MAHLLQKLKDTPPYRFVRAAKARVERWMFERGDLADTGGIAELEEFGLEQSDRHRYQPSAWSFLRRALRRIEVSPDDVFLDLGSGKGRVVWQAAQHPFARVIGVEIAPELTQVAQRNIDRNRERLAAGKVELITADAGEYEIPDDVNYIYIYSSFGGELFRQVLSNIVASLDRRPRALTLIYANPHLEEVILETGRFERTHVLKGGRPDVRETSWVNLYSSRPLLGQPASGPVP